MEKKSAITPPMPKFEPQIPEYLTELDSASEKYIIRELSILSQQNKWQSDIIEVIHNRVGRIESKIETLERFQNTVSERFLINDNLKKQKEVFNQKKSKWLKIGMYIFFIFLYPLYLLSINELSGESFKTILKLLF